MVMGRLGRARRPAISGGMARADRANSTGLICEAVSARGTALRPKLLGVWVSVVYMSAFGVVYGSDRTARTK